MATSFRAFLRRAAVNLEVSVQVSGFLTGLEVHCRVDNAVLFMGDGGLHKASHDIIR